MGQDRSLTVRQLGRVEYEPAWRAMQAFTAQRNAETADELWLCEHPPVFTLGLAGKPEHLLRDIGIPVVKIDRGGQITYHGPGQIVCYLLLDLKQRGLTVKGLVNRMEQSLIDLLAGYGVAAERLAGAPGVYVSGAKIGALGLKVKNGCCYHGLALNVRMDLTPFSAINPCGYAGMAVTQLSAFVPDASMGKVGANLIAQLQEKLSLRVASGMQMTEVLVSENLYVDASKIVDYLLSRSNSHGKAVFFFGFGFLPEEWERLATALKQHARTYPISAQVDSLYGTRYSVDGELETPTGRRPRVRTVWIREADSDALRLITAHPI